MSSVGRNDLNASRFDGGSSIRNTLGWRTTARGQMIDAGAADCDLAALLDSESGDMRSNVDLTPPDEREEFAFRYLE